MYPFLQGAGSNLDHGRMSLVVQLEVETEKLSRGFLHSFMAIDKPGMGSLGLQPFIFKTLTYLQEINYLCIFLFFPWWLVCFF